MVEKTPVKTVVDPNLLASPIFNKRKVIFSRIKRKLLKHVWFLRGIILGLVLVSIYLLIVLTQNLIKTTGVQFYYNLGKNFVFTPEESIKASNNRTNILILGKGGEGHEAKDLTDTIIFASVNNKDPSVYLISLPRDIWIKELRTKLNSIYYWGNQKQERGGLILAKATVEEIVGQPVHYGIVIDFLGFKKLIDALGGIEVDVERSFTDERYPIAGRENDSCDGDPEFKCRYETISFTQGRQFMNGETALKFVRSRNAKGDEGTDFARAARQQKVILAIKEKILSKEILLSPQKILALKDTILQSIETDISPSAGAILARRLLQVNNKIRSYVLPEELLINPPKSPKYDYLYVFIPKDGNWDQIRNWVSCVLEKNKCD